jgi:uncharacterized protein YkwD
MPILAVPPAHVAAVQSQAERAIVREINRMRRAHGLRAVRISSGLARVARSHSRKMLKANLLTHSSLDGSSFGTRLARAGKRRRYGETLAWAPNGSGTGAHMVVTLWMHSPPHRAVLMDSGLRRIGVGRVYGSMGRRRGAAITADFSS